MDKSPTQQVASRWKRSVARHSMRALATIGLSSGLRRLSISKSPDSIWTCQPHLASVAHHTTQRHRTNQKRAPRQVWNEVKGFYLEVLVATAQVLEDNLDNFAPAGSLC